MICSHCSLPSPGIACKRCRIALCERHAQFVKTKTHRGKPWKQGGCYHVCAPGVGCRRKKT